MIVITNDDGIDAPGLAALAQAVEGPTLIVAPREPMSECSHRVTTKCPLQLDQRGPHRWAVDGTPADCVRVALLHLAPKLAQPVELVVSGINNGGNLGADIYISGTVAAAREAAFWDIPGIALSQYKRTPATDNWARNPLWARRVLALLRAQPYQPGTLWNVNFPDLPADAPDPAIILCPKSTRPLPVKYEHNELGLAYIHGRYHSRPYEPGSDIDICFHNQISASLLHL